MEIKFINGPFFRRKEILLFIMRTFIFLFCTTVFSFSPGNIFSQNTKITIAADKVVTIYEVFDLIREQTDYTFIYPSDLFKDSPKVQLKKGVIAANTLLEKSLSANNFSFSLASDKSIIVKPIPKPIDDVQQDPIRITGKVTDEDGVPLPDVAVRIAGTNLGVATNFDGEYTLIVPSRESVLVFSSIGFATKEIRVNGQTVIDVTMQEAVSQLDEVILNAGYYNVTERTKTGSIAKVEAKTIAQQPVLNPVAALPGRIAGVQIVQEGGVPGSGFTVRIRGQNSINSGNEPFYVIDGIPYDSQTLSDRNVSGGIFNNGNASPLSFIDPSNIESIEVLKDADATAIYGSRGANGVVLITTKKGKEGKTSFSFGVNSGLANTSKSLDLLNTEQYLEVRREAFANDGFDPVPEAFEPFFPDLFAWDPNRSTDWQEELIGGTAFTQNYRATVSGGNKTTQFLLGGSYLTETSIFPGDFKYGRGTVNANINHTSSDGRFKILFSANYSTETNDLPRSGLSNAAVRLSPNAPTLLDSEGNINFENGTFGDNPLTLLERKYQSKSSALLANAVLSYQILPNLEIKANLGQSSTDLEDFRTDPSSANDPSLGIGPEGSLITVNSGKRRSWIIEPQITWEHHISKGKLQVLAGSTFQKQTDEQLLLIGLGFTSDALIENLSAASRQFIRNDDQREYKYNAVFGRINYNWEDRYILNLTARRDGSSRFGPGRQFGNFGAIGAAWLFSNENFLKDSSFLSFGKLRGSYGTSGNDQIGDYQFLDTYRVAGVTYDGIEGLETSRLFNPDFSWETNRKLELALELGLFNNRVLMNGSYFHNISTNQLTGIPLAATTGFRSIQSNLEAKVRNTGFELEINTINIQNENFQWTSSFNVTLPRNELVEFPRLEESTFANQFVVGEPLNIRRLYNNLGVNPETGLYEFEDFNDDGMITSPEDRQITEDLTPEYFGGLSNNITYKNWKLDVFFQFTKQKALDFLTAFFPGSGGNFPVELLNRWQEPGDEADFQRYTAGFDPDASRAFGFNTLSNNSVVDASFIRLKNVSLGYTLPKSILKGTQCELYLQGQNLFTITDFIGPDPEQISSFLPILRRYNFGVNLIF